jgi:acyl-ACP thioesterase
MEPVYSQSFEITDLHVDCCGRMLPSKILYLMQEVAGNHFAQLSMDYDSLASRGLFWAITRNKVQISRLPLRGEKIRLETWPMPTTRVAYPRATEGFDAEGNSLFKVISLWVIMDMDTRVMVLPGKSGIIVPGILRGGDSRKMKKHRR